MERLLTDVLTRRICQIAICALFAGLALVAIVTLIISAGRLAGFVGAPWTDAMIALLEILALPLEETYGQISTVFLSVFPQLVAAVCFEVDPGPPVKQSTKRNASGRAAVLALLVGTVCWALVLAFFIVSPTLFAELVGDGNNFVLAKASVVGLVSFQFIYLVRLLGLEDLK